jgi:hypothetical protein
MLKKLEKHWIAVSILLLLTILASLLFLPNAAQVVSLFILLIILALAIAFAVQKQVKAQREGRIDRITMRRNIAFDIVGILLTLATAVLAGRAAGQWVAGAVQQVGGAVWPVVLAGLCVALAAGFVAGAAVQSVWARLTRPKRLAFGKMSVE